MLNSSGSLDHNTSMDSGGPRRKLKDNRGAFHKKGVKDDSDMIGREAFHKKTAALSPRNKKKIRRRGIDGRSEGANNPSVSSEGEFKEFGDIVGTRAAADELLDLDRIKIGRKFIVYRGNDPIFKLTEPVEPKKNETKCVFCERDMTDLEIKNCSFCGHIACLRCCHKKMNFMPKPGQTIAL